MRKKEKNSKPPKILCHRINPEIFRSNAKTLIIIKPEIFRKLQVLACMQMTMCSQVSQMLVAGTTDVTLEPLLVIQFDAHIVVIVVYKGGCLWGEFSFDGRW